MLTIASGYSATVTLVTSAAYDARSYVLESTSSHTEACTFSLQTVNTLLEVTHGAHTLCEA